MKPIKDYLPYVLIRSVRSLRPAAKKKELMRMYHLGLISPEQYHTAIVAYCVEEA